MQKVLRAKGAKSHLHGWKLGLYACETGLKWCKRLLGELCSLGRKDLLLPLLTTFRTFLLATLSQATWRARVERRTKLKLVSQNPSSFFEQKTLPALHSHCTSPPILLSLSLSLCLFLSCLCDTLCVPHIVCYVSHRLTLKGVFWLAAWMGSHCLQERLPSTRWHAVASFRETLCESGRWIDALKKRGRVLKKRGRVLKKRGRFLRRGV